MSAYEEQHDVERFRAWWKNYGNALLAGIALGIALLYGNKYWQTHKEKERLAASELYLEVLAGQQQHRLDLVRAATEQLGKQYGSTPYASMAAMIAAQVAYEAGDSASARAQLKWALENTRDASLQHAARLRLGRLHMSAKEFDAALALTQQKSMDGFAGEYLELRGDALRALNRRDEARQAYREALTHVGANNYRTTLQMKLDDLGPEHKP
jgi:predicted negative regulator of RcsB-dependent stress response